MEINSLLEQHKKDDPGRDKYKYKSHIFLCFLITKYLNRFQKQIEKAENRLKNSQPNIFDKQEVFEIGYKEDSGLLPGLEISIPVVGYDIIRQLQSYFEDENKTRYSLLPSIVDLSFWCSPVRDQGSLNSCTAFAAISLYEYFVNRAFNKKIDASPLFLYKATRNKMNITEDVGASIRETMKALALYGVPPESSWSYNEEKVDEEPPAYCYSYAQNYQSLKYFLLDYAGISKETLLFQIKAVLAAGFPCIFGFTIYNSAYDDSNKPGHIPFLAPKNDQVVGGHTVVAVGYDDFKLIQCADRTKYSKGAFLIRNSWGEDWGVKGYGWLPYDYVLAGLTAAWWSLIKAEWFNEGNFGAAGAGGGTGARGNKGG
ncbi:MAG: C1 family peptidase [Okeania sp. SIO3B5]|nr:C1 family peptidase [Okeania sp. SIO3B5]